jgi:uncharacterized membrane protein YqiK
VVAVVVAIPIVFAILFKVLWKVPAADEALIVTGFGVKGRAVGDRIFKIVTGGGALVFPVLQKAQYLTTLTVLNGAQGISEIIAQVIGQAGPALEMAQATLASRRTSNGAKPAE